VASYVRRCDFGAEAGLYVQVRLGPNMTGGVDGGGTPSWVLGRPGYLRTDDPKYTRLWTQWYDAVIPRVRDASSIPPGATRSRSRSRDGQSTEAPCRCPGWLWTA
jgi:hypothetical protein